VSCYLDTFEQARELGILWAPLEDKSGRKQPHWETMQVLQPGDIVFHFAKTKVRGISTVQAESRIAEIKILDRGQWNNLGREVDVLVQDFDFVLGLEDIPIEMRMDSGKSIETPFDKRGKVKQGYLYAVPPQIAEHLLETLNLIDRTSQTPIDRQLSNILGAYEGGTDKVITGILRREQGALRARLFGGKSEAQCAICGREIETDMLVAAHIKPRSVCSETERLDSNVVMPACLVGCDALFEKGYVFVDGEGFVRKSQGTKTPDLSAVIDRLDGTRSAFFNPESEKYFAWHRENVVRAHF
jgi:hypothetical protein